MGIDAILKQIDAEIALLKQVRELLSNTVKPAGNIVSGAVKKVARKARKKNVLSAEARKRIADAQRRRWAAHKAKSKAKAK